MGADFSDWGVLWLASIGLIAHFLALAWLCKGFWGSQEPMESSPNEEGIPSGSWPGVGQWPAQHPAGNPGRQFHESPVIHPYQWGLEGARGLPHPGQGLAPPGTLPHRGQGLLPPG